MSSQFAVLFRKDWIYWKRNRVASILELLLPIILCAIMIAVKNIIDKYTWPNVPAPVLQVPTAVSPALLAQGRRLRFGFKNCNDTRGGGYIALVPQNPITDRLKTLFDAMEYSTRFFPDNDALNAEITSDNYTIGTYQGFPNQACLAVVFSSATPQNITYSLRFNTSVSGDGDMYKTQLNSRVRYQVEDQKSYNLTRDKGPLSLQMLIEAMIVSDSTGINMAASFQKFMTPEYTYADYTGTILNMLPLLLILCTLTSFMRVITRVVEEREAKNIEHMENMGLSKGYYLLSAYVMTLITQLLVSIVVAILLRVGILFNVNWFLIFLVYFFFSMSLMSIGFFVSGFFMSTKRAIITGLIVFLILFLFYVLRTSVPDPSEGLSSFVSITPTGAMTQLARNFLTQANYQRNFNFSELADEVYFFKGQTFFIVCVIEWIGFTLLAFYLLYVWPHEYGVAKHPLFIFGWKDRQQTEVSPVHELQALEEAERQPVDEKGAQAINPDNFEEVEVEFQAQEAKGKTIKIQNLYKVYNNGKKAVNNLNLDIYSDQIFALLGHNGAGKTTTISMISGLLPITRGSISICGLDSKADHDRIKQIMGTCPQVNPVFGYMTVWEHMELYGNIKGVGKELKAEGEKLLHELDLFHKRNYLASKLSGGQKRKLCVALAFVGNSKVVLLDEPTSGMDTYARRHLWEMVKKYKKDRLIILTTHNMDEADFLGDRIGIMSEGRLVTCGSPIFLKKRFGDGYELTVLKSAGSTPEAVQRLKDLVQTSIAGSRIISEIGTELKFRLPETQTGFRNLFREMEENQEALGIQSFGIDMNTLEDVFIKVARISTGRDTDQRPVSQGSAVVHRLESPGSVEDKIQNEDPLSMDLKRLTEINPNHTGQQLKALLRKRYLNVVRDWGTLICEILMPIVAVIIGLGIAKLKFFSSSPMLAVTPAIYQGGQNFTANSLSPDLSTDPVRALLTNFNSSSFAFNQTSPTNLDAFNAVIFNQNSTNQLFSFFFSMLTPTFVNYTLLFNTTAPFIPFVAVNQLTNAILASFKASNPTATVPTVNFVLDPLPLTKGYSSLNATASGFIVVILIIQAFALIPNSLIQFIVKERENNSKHQQVVSGTDVRVYWLSNFIVDYAKYLIPGVVIYLMFFAFGADFFYNGAKAGYSILLIVLYGIPLILMTYCLSFLFTSPGNAQIVAFILFSFVSMVLVILSFALKLIESTRDVGLNVIPYIFNLISPFSFGDGFMNLANDFLYGLAYKWSPLPGPFDTKLGGLALIYLGCFSFFYLGLLMLIEYWYVISKRLRSSRKKSEPVYESGKWRGEADRTRERMAMDQDVDEDVLAEEEAVKKQTKAFSLYVEDLKKVYSVPGNGLCSGYFKKRAVNGVTFGVEQGSVFSLLGTNGAGKTTTFKILTGDITATEGQAVIRGHVLPDDLGVIRQLVGYCPQFDSLSDKLTAEEHLKLYCDLKGIHPKYQKELIENMLASLNLTPYRNVQAETYSGGNKRKLSIAIALIGQPPIVFLDEPSAGMDPEARRFMWNFIAEISNKRSQSSIVLTTHSMEEAQALSNKVGIMVEGKLKTIGTTQRLKDKYGKGFEVEIKLTLASDELIAALTESYRSMVKFRRPEVMTEDELKTLLQKIGRSDLVAEIVDGGRGSAIRQRLKSTGEVEEGVVVEWVRLQNELARVQQALAANFEMSLVEAYQSYAKFNINAKHRLSEIFGFFEKDLENLNVANFSVRALSLEQIFIQFAQGINHED